MTRRKGIEIVGVGSEDEGIEMKMKLIRWDNLK